MQQDKHPYQRVFFGGLGLIKFLEVFHMQFFIIDLDEDLMSGLPNLDGTKNQGSKWSWQNGMKIVKR